MNRLAIKKLAFKLSQPFSLKGLQQISGQNFIFPFYHLVTNSPSPCVKHLYPVPTEKQFRQELDFLLAHFSPADYQQVLHFAKSGENPKKPSFFLSFDDGFAECYHVIAPVLKEKGIPAAFFINPAFVGNKQLSHRQKVSLIINEVCQTTSSNLLQKAGALIGKTLDKPDDLVKIVRKFTISDIEKTDTLATLLKIDFDKALKKFHPYMSLSEIRQLQSDGFIIGSHSFGHPEFHVLNEERMKSEIEQSFRYIESNLQIEHRVFSFPFSDLGVPPSIFKYLTNEMNVEISFGTSGIKRDEAPHHLQRIPLEVYGFNGAEDIIRSEYFYYLGKALIGKNLVKRK